MNLATGEDHQNQPIEHILSLPIILSERIRTAVHDSKSYKPECTQLLKQVNRLAQMLRDFVRRVANSTPFYDRPVLHVFLETIKTLNRTLTLVRKCRRNRIFLRVISIASANEFRKVFVLLEASVGDMKWLLSIFAPGPTSAGGAGGEDTGINLSLPPIASNYPIIAWVWSYICSLYISPLAIKVDAANALCSLADDNIRNKKIIVEEGGVPPLLKLLNEDSPEAQIGAGDVLFSLASNQDRARVITSDLGVPIIVQCFQKRTIRARLLLAKLIARMAEYDEVSQEAFGRENVIRPLVNLLSSETVIADDYKKSFGFYGAGSSVSASSSGRENEPSELKLELKTYCARALWMLSRGNLANSKILAGTNGLSILAKLIETETGELHKNCLMSVIEITAAAEKNPDLRRSAFKTSSPAAKAIVDQLLRLINDDSETIGFKIPAIRAIGSLARTFPARETRVISPLVKQLSHQNPDVETESAIALGKFTSPDNFLCNEHSKTIIEFDGVAPLMRLLRRDERTQYHALVLLCYLAMHAGNSEGLVQARVLTALEGADKSIVGQHSQLKELVGKAIYHLNMYHAGVVLSQRQPYHLEDF